MPTHNNLIKNMARVFADGSPSFYDASLQKNAQAGILLGFGILLLLMFLISWMSLTQMHQNQRQLEKILHEHVTKLELITQMRYASRERSIALMKIILMNDVFEQDEVFLLFNQYGSQFAETRQAYIALGLSEEERNILDIQSQFIRINIPLQLNIIDFVMTGNKGGAHNLLINQAIPIQDKILEQLNKLHDMQKLAAESAMRMQAQHYEQARTLIFVSVGLIAALGITVAIVVFLRTDKYQRELYETREKARVTLRSIGESVIAADKYGNLEYLNPQAETLLKCSLENMQGQSLKNVLDIRLNNEKLEIQEIIHESLVEGKRYVSEPGMSLLVGDNEIHSIEFSAAPIMDRFGQITGTVIAIRDITRLQILSEEISFQATHDSLTGLLNRHEFERRVHLALEQSRMDQDEHAVCFIDLDMFKVVNDTSGHIAGDELLRQLSILLQNTIRKTDSLSRLGGDEFGLLLHSCSMEKARTIAENVLSVIESFRFYWENRSFSIGASIGIAPILPDSGTLMSIMQTADFACYSAKDAGRNRVFAADLNSDLLQKRQGDAQWMSRLNEAIDQGSFVLYAQDIVPLSTKTHEHRHVELLLRLRNELNEIVTPMAFIPAAERYHLMPLIDRWVVKEAVSLLLMSKSHNQQIKWRVSINLSGQSLSDRRFLGYLLDLIESSQVDPESLCFEITETCAISNLSGAIRFMNTLRGVGCHFALDDFGSGLSSFAYLKNLPIDSVKIDGVFVRDLVHDLTQRAIVTSISRVARVMKIQTIAEFVENRETCELLREIGVDYVQGYFTGKPAPFKDILMNQLDQSSSGKI